MFDRFHGVFYWDAPDPKITLSVDADIFVRACRAFIEEEKETIQKNVRECILFYRRRRNKPWRKYHKSFFLFKWFKKRPPYYTYKQVKEELFEEHEVIYRNRQDKVSIIGSWSYAQHLNIVWAEENIAMIDCAYISKLENNEMPKVTLDGHTYRMLRKQFDIETCDHIAKIKGSKK